MKKILIALFLALVLVLVMVACDGGDKPVETTADTVVDTQTVTQAETEVGVNDTTADTVQAESEASAEDNTNASVEEATHTPTGDVTDAPAGDVTDAPTGDVTEAATEAATEAETKAPVNVNGDCGNVFWAASSKKVSAPVLDSFKHQVSGRDYKNAIPSGWKVTVTENTGIFEIRGWVGMNFSNFELAWRVGTNNEVQYRNWSVSPVSREAAVLQAAQALGFSNATGFVYYFGIEDFKSGDELHLFIKDKDTDTVYCFCEIVVNIQKTEAPTIDEKYELGHGSTMDMSAYDPITNKETPTAPYDDASLKLWFDHITEKVARYDISGKDSGATDYTIQMAKNEIEGCQFFLYSPSARKITIKISDFENANGDKLETDLGVEYYIEDGYLPHLGYPAEYVYPDAVVPYESYIGYSSNTENGRYGNNADTKLDYGHGYVCIGPFSGSDWDHAKYPFRESIRGFVVEAKTTKDSAPGAYKATVEIYDADTGNCIKMANVYTYVYDVTLSDETALDTAFGLWDIVPIYMYHYNTNADMTRYTDVEITKAVANYFLEQRITLTGSLTYYNVMGVDWFKNPRVTSVRVLTKDHYDSMKNDPILAPKMFYYGQDEPGVPRGWRPIGFPDGSSENVYDNTGLLSVLAIAKETDLLKSAWGWENPRMLIPFERNMDFTTFNPNTVDKTTAYPAWADQYMFTTEKDAIEYLSKHVKVWVPVLFSYTPRDLGKAMGAQFMQNTAQDEAFGEFSDRLSGYVANGAERWTYVACEPQYTSPYQNILLFNDGTEGRTMFWTSYLNDVTGFLYWHVSFYEAEGNNTYTLRTPFSKTGPGDGILVYPGSAFNQLDPIPSIRLLNMRDGIEEYQLLTMLEAAKGEAYTDELVSHIVTSTLTYTRDDDVIYNVHSYLLRALEAAANN